MGAACSNQPPVFHAEDIAVADDQMVIDHHAEFAGLTAEYQSVLDVELAGVGASGWMIVRKQNAPCIEVHGAPENSARCQQNMSIAAFGNYLFCDHERSGIGKDCDHTLFGKILHGHEKVGEQRGAILSQRRSNELFAHPVMNKAPHHQKRINPTFPAIGCLAQLNVRRLCNPADRTKPVE